MSKQGTEQRDNLHQLRTVYYYGQQIDNLHQVMSLQATHLLLLQGLHYLIMMLNTSLSS